MERIYVNVNGETRDFVPPKEVLGTIFLQLIPWFEYMSLEALNQMLTKAFEMVEETVGKRYVGTMRAVFKVKRFSRKAILSYIWNTILAGEGMGLMPGLGYASCERVEGKTKVIGISTLDPERQSIVDIEPL